MRSSRTNQGSGLPPRYLDVSTDSRKMLLPVDSALGEIAIDGDFIMGRVAVGVEGVDDVCVVHGLRE